ncbi:uncharacterized protein LOC133204989 [Saccostrea echinata]|uniref:uncharacterized protein LOC133204989 n=1 Tax=Saccostrea echinata TaxID=191078 RepID=UPI002A8102A2|nr:uncharacterized protein LOC133204989 [Saccostrea echinata]
MACRSEEVIYVKKQSITSQIFSLTESEKSCAFNLGMINSIGDKQIKCQRALDYITEKTKMACLSEEVIYVKKQAITSHISSLAGSEKSCAFNLVKGAYTQFLPLNDSISNSTPFIAGISCNLKKNRLFDFSGNNWKTTKTFRDVHLVTNSFYGNFTCEVYGTIHLLSLLEVSGASLNLYGDDEKLYNNDNRNVYGTDITYSGLNANHTNHTRYIFKIYTEWKGRVWIHLKGHLIINCSKISELHTLTTVDTDKNLTKINTSTNIVHSKDLKSQTRLFLLLLLIGVVVALTLMAGVHILQRRYLQSYSL